MDAQNYIKAIRAARLLDNPAAEIARRQDETRKEAAKLRDGGMATDPPPWRIF